MRGDRLLDTVELDQHGPLLQAVLVDLRRLATGQKSPSAGSECRTGQLGVGGKFLRGPSQRDRRFNQ
jgi:hypothetical protein